MHFYALYNTIAPYNTEMLHSCSTMMPGHPRYQPKTLEHIFAYEHLYNDAARVELAVLRTLGDIGVIPKKDIQLLTPAVEASVLKAVTASRVEHIERTVTKHDVRALVHIIQDALPTPLRRWVHIPLTSNDVLSTAQALQFARAHEALRPLIHESIRTLALLVRTHAHTTQVGRTHGQHALPITVGFWFATLLNRFVANAERMERASELLRGKISGAVGAYNAQVALGIDAIARKKTTGGKSYSFEERALTHLGLTPAPISTQLTPPEPVAEYLFASVLLSATCGQLGRDARHLMRTEVGEIREEFAKGQVGSSTMAHKRNPITFENLEGMWLRTKNEFGKVLDTLISEHQRDLVGSSVVRDFPIISINLAQQLETLTRKKDGKTFLERLTVDSDALQKNLATHAEALMAEPLYIALQMSGYQGDAHELVNHTLMPRRTPGESLLGLARTYGESSDPELREALKTIPKEVLRQLEEPTRYTGNAAKKALETVRRANIYLRRAKRSKSSK